MPAVPAVFAVSETMGAERTTGSAACPHSGQVEPHPGVQQEGPDGQRLDLPDVRQRQLVPPWLLHRWPGPVLHASRSDLVAGGLVLHLRQPQLGTQKSVQQVELQLAPVQRGSAAFLKQHVSLSFNETRLGAPWCPCRLYSPFCEDVDACLINEKFVPVGTGECHR